ncbi:MAG: class I SAM-dependent methyltransferase [Bryobacteraceae bacterium]|nr:class I SAM-dependent methyltransferase [Bryobacteraceae bacterium]
MSGDRPAVVAQTQFAAKRDEMAELDLRRRFEYIYRENLWSNAESRSGEGSSAEETRLLRVELPRTLAELGAGSLLDVPCGDFHWLSEVELGIPYIGGDIVEELVARNRERYSRPGREFVTLDLTRDALPKADAILCRDCLVHLSFANIERALENMQRSGARFFLLTTFLGQEENRDIEDGDWRPLNFTRAPFHLPAPVRAIVEGCEEAGGAYRDKALGVWTAAALGA